MLSKDPNYRRIPLSGRTPTGRCSYWLAPDHLLLVEVQFVTETYRRFALRDIAGIVVRSTRAFEFWTTIGGVVVLGSAAVSVGFINNNESPGFLVTAGILFVLSFLATLVHLVRGRTAYCELITAVQTVRLPGVSRQKKAELLIRLLATAARELEAASPSPAPSAPAAPDILQPVPQPLDAEPSSSPGEPAPGDPR